MLINLEKMRLLVMVKPFVLNNQTKCPFTAIKRLDPSVLIEPQDDWLVACLVGRSLEMFNLRGAQ